MKAITMRPLWLKMKIIGRSLGILLWIMGVARKKILGCEAKRDQGVKNKKVKKDVCLNSNRFLDRKKWKPKNVFLPEFDKVTTKVGWEAIKICTKNFWKILWGGRSKYFQNAVRKFCRLSAGFLQTKTPINIRKNCSPGYTLFAISFDLFNLVWFCQEFYSLHNKLIALTFLECIVFVYLLPKPRTFKFLNVQKINKLTSGCQQISANMPFLMIRQIRIFTK